MRHFTLFLAILAILACFTLAACGDDEENTTTDASDTTMADTTTADTTTADTTADTPVAGGECHSNADCPAPNEECGDRNPHAVCGIAPQEGCSTDTDCGTSVCSVIIDSCSRDGFGSECQAACTSNADCGAGLRCNNGGACEAVPCDDATSAGCPSYQLCDPTQIDASAPVYDRHDGCFDVTCAIDADCDTMLACVNGRCQEGPGTCAEPMAVP